MGWAIGHDGLFHPKMRLRMASLSCCSWGVGTCGDSNGFREAGLNRGRGDPLEGGEEAAGASVGSRLAMASGAVAFGRAGLKEGGANSGAGP